ncbi:reverse transcriptase domain-containing protein [Labrys sp. 22185]|uniref:reverse transcriptase domain-containing protein n=1 Tax=Labrys sp. 22185 TaxID=3453888 RepID=UPI003F83CFE0
MPVAFETYQYSYLRKGKPVFVPSERGEKIGRALKAKVEQATAFDGFYYHLREGGHVAALHVHRDHRYFARLDIERFFYGIGRNRVARELHAIGIERAGTMAKWSCVRNPFNEPRYALPYGFVQSPILATLVLMHSGVGNFLRRLPKAVTASVYMDDIALSSDNKGILEGVYTDLRRVLDDGNFTINENKVYGPAEAIELFNCELTQHYASVLQARRDEFHQVERSATSVAAFAKYCEQVEAGNAVPPQAA